MHKRLMSRFQLAAVAIAVVLGAMVLKSILISQFAPSPANASPFDATFQLVDQNGQKFTSEMLEHKPRALFFGYTSCPDICPTTLAALSRWIDEAKISQTRFVFVTVDPEHDTPDVLKRYLSSFAPGIVGLTGSPENVSKVLNAFHVFRQRVTEPDGSYTMNHTASIFLVDGQGDLQSAIAHDEPDASAIAKLKRLDGSGT